MSQTNSPRITTPLGPKQIEWCRKELRTFDVAWRAVEAAKLEAAKTYKKLGVEPGAVNQESAQ